MRIFLIYYTSWLTFGQHPFRISCYLGLKICPFASQVVTQFGYRSETTRVYTAFAGLAISLLASDCNDLVGERIELQEEFALYPMFVLR